MDQPRTAVIGAGISGLTASKMLGDYAVPYVCFESSDRVGGNWAFGNPNGHSSAYRSLHIDTSKHQLSFRDFPIPDHFPDFPHHTQIKQYLDAYTAAFGLDDHIEFGNGVEHARRLPEGGWELRTQRTGTRHFDLLVVANGHHWDPRYPDFPGEFDGTTLHAHHYIDPHTPIDFAGKRILVVGLGNSAADIAVELSSRALGTTLTLSTRSGAWIVPKYIAGRPADKYYRTSPYVPYSWQRRIAQWGQPLTAGRPEMYGLPAPNHRFFEAHPTQSVELPLRLGSGDVIAKPDIARFDGPTVHFTDGTAADFDVIVYATGYNITFPFFDPEFLSAPDNRIDLYKRMFVPGVDDLIFAGFAQATPTLFPFVESQSRLVGAYAAGRYRLPSEERMRQVIVSDQQHYTGHMLDRPRHTQQVDYFLYDHDMRTRELPEGARRARRYGGPACAAAYTPPAAAPPPEGAPPRSLSFDSHGTRCDAWYFAPTIDGGFANGDGHPVVVMAHGFGGTKDSGLEPFARRLADAGLGVLAFDYRGFGASDGQPRQRVSMRDQARDYHAALRAAAELPGADPRRLVLWGISQSGGHALTVAAERTDVAAVVAVMPMVHGLAAGRHALRQVGPGTLAGSTVAGIRSAVGARLGRAPVMMPLVGRPGERAALTASGYYESYLALAGPTWRNEIDAAVGLELGGYRADRHADRIGAPVLVQIADHDRAAPPQAAVKAAVRARAQVRHYPCDHFDLFAGNPWFGPATDHQIHFLRGHLVSERPEAVHATDTRNSMTDVETSA